ncbi:hypothetical protein CYMTET_25623 [Cymbomonas tetramitiformis]|uniref:C2 domain-containing protein n=1 Tax=Cymbomonas tetramitiformis TaxID=36881 RepID=A0AAE0FTR6_9CHLO|nr:hypothetical protein CYMTET_25623 [Cymbomonas tetramitiformis]
MVVAVPEFCYVHFQKAKLHFSHRREIDPYVRVTVFQGDCSYEHTLQTLAVLGGGQNTTLCAKNRNLLTFSLPKEACELYVAGGCNLRLRLEVFDEDLLTQDDFIGFCTVKLPLEEAESSKMTWNLTDIRYEPAGEIECNAEILMTDDGPRLNLEVLSLSHLMQMQVEESNSERRLLVMAFGMLLIYVLLGVFFYVPMEVRPYRQCDLPASWEDSARNWETRCPAVVASAGGCETDSVQEVAPEGVDIS